LKAKKNEKLASHPLTSIRAGQYFGALRLEIIHYENSGLGLCNQKVDNMLIQIFFYMHKNNAGQLMDFNKFHPVLKKFILPHKVLKNLSR
jgi:hypothetical protein